ncbi:MAG TPA: protein translocase subunit SecD [Vicinamibacterales bacterium]|nr:protein translocase subunit SecD [Vicinamibacterales bacterium]
MYKNLRWKLLTIVAITALAVWSFMPPGEKVRLGLDLQGGIHLVLQVHTDDALRLETETTAEQLQQALRDEGIAVGRIAADGLTRFVAEGVPPARDQDFRRISQLQAEVNFDRVSAGGGTYRYDMRPNMALQRRDEAVTQAIQTIERRVNELGVSEPVVAPYGSAGDQIVVQLPGLRDIDRAKGIIRSTAMLELKIVEGGWAPDEATLLQPHGGQVPVNLEVVPGVSGSGAQAVSGFYLVRRTAAVTGADLRNASQTIDDFGQPAVSFSLNADGAAKFGRVTTENVGRQLAIILDGRIQSAPTIETRIDREGRITGNFTNQEAADLSLVLRSGALPASLSYLEERQVGPTLGQDSIRAGVTASLTGLALVTLFMLVYYRLAGINAFVSITLNLLILMGFMAYLGAVMTLPGIAGFILTIGMGVDSNVLIFERIREELATKKGARQAIAAGFDRVFVTIVDTHVASLIAAAFLFQFGTGPIRGFATTLFFGLLSNIFTAVFVSRTIFEFILSQRPAGSARLSI